MSTQSSLLSESYPSNPRSFFDCLSGPNAFYNSPNYLESTQNDLRAKTSLPPTYTWNTEHKIIRIAKQILSMIIFPIGLYQLVHSLAAKVGILPASNRTLMKHMRRCPENYANNTRSNISLDSEWKYKRFTVDVDGYKIDAYIVGKPSTLNNRRWMLFSNGNGEFYENKLAYNYNFKQILSKVDSNAIVFNYPGVGASSGLPNRQAMAKAYRAMLNLLEDRNNGIGAKEIIGYGHSIGGGAQGDALKTHELKKDIKYVFVKSRTFSDLSTTVSILMFKPLGFLVKIFGWNMDSVESSKNLQAPEIIIQTARVKGYEELTDSSKIIYDEVIPAEASLAKVLLDDHECPKHNKLFIGMQGRHNYKINPTYLAKKIHAYLRT